MTANRWPFEAEARFPGRWNVRHVRTQTFESCAWKCIARGGVCGTDAENAAELGDVARDAAEVEAVVVEDEAVENIGVCPLAAVGEGRSQRKIAPSEPPKTRIEYTR